MSHFTSLYPYKPNGNIIEMKIQKKAKVIEMVNDRVKNSTTKPVAQSLYSINLPNKGTDLVPTETSFVVEPKISSRDTLMHRMFFVPSNF